MSRADRRGPAAGSPARGSPAASQPCGGRPADRYTGCVPEPRRYQLQNEDANRQILNLLEAAGVPRDKRGYLQQLVTTVLKLHEDGASVPDLRITNAALKELRYSYKVFAPYRHVRKVTVFGSARTPRVEPAAEAAALFGQRMVEAGWMVVTGAGSGCG